MAFRPAHLGTLTPGHRNLASTAAALLRFWRSDRLIEDPGLADLEAPAGIVHHVYRMRSDDELGSSPRGLTVSQPNDLELGIAIKKRDGADGLAANRAGVDDRGGKRHDMIDL